MPNVLTPDKYAKVEFGLLATRPLVKSIGYLYYAVDNGIIYYYNGATWEIFTTQKAAMYYGTTGNYPLTPITGAMYYDTTVNLLYYWTGSAWTLVNAYDNFVESYEDTNDITIFGKHFDVTGVGAFAYRLIGYITNKGGAPDDIFIRLNDQTGTSYDFVSMSGTGIGSVQNANKFIMAHVGDDVEVLLDYVIGGRGGYVSIVGNCHTHGIAYNTLVKGHTWGDSGAIDDIYVYMGVNSIGKLILTKIDEPT